MDGQESSRVTASCWRRRMRATTHDGGSWCRVGSSTFGHGWFLQRTCIGGLYRDGRSLWGVGRAVERLGPVGAKTTPLSRAGQCGRRRVGWRRKAARGLEREERNRRRVCRCALH
jgi:hypothetical protein